jgi:cobalt-zinc-cadmium efflux system membrane fusion protein
LRPRQPIASACGRVLPMILRSFDGFARVFAPLAVAMAAHAGAQAAEATLALQATQVQALGVRVQAVDTAEASVARLPATVVIPPQQQRVLSAPMAGLVEALNVSVGDAVKAGQVLALMRSAQAQELARDVLTSDSQATLSAGNRERDEQLYKEGLIPLARLESSRALARQAQLQQQERRRALAGVGASADGSVLLLKAPISGVVLARPAVIGQRLEAAAPLYQIANLSNLWMEMQVPAADAAVVKLGDHASVAGTQIQGHVITIGHTVDAGSQSVLVRAALQAPAAGLRAGQVVEAQLARKSESQVTLPDAAVLGDGARKIVFLEAAPGQYRVTPVQVLRSAGGRSSVSGLQSGSKVVVQGTAALKALLAEQRP